jgi:hypothetical protein
MIMSVQQVWDTSEFDDEFSGGDGQRELDTRRGDFPVRSHAARTRARMRGRATGAARRKAQDFRGMNCRRRKKPLAWAN